MNQSTWIARLKELHETRHSHHWALGDHVNFGITTWGTAACFEALQQITGTKNTANFYRRCATVAAHFPAELRVSSLSFATYEALRHFPMSFLEQFIPEVAASGRSCKQVLHLAIEQFGSNPAPHKKWLMRHQVNLKMSVYLAALERAKADGTRVQCLIEQVLTVYLGAETVGAQKEEQGSRQTNGNEADDSSPRPTYAERRAAQKAEKLAAKEAAAQQRRETTEANKARREAQKLATEQKRIDRRAARLAKKGHSTVHIAFVDCKGRGKDFVDTEKGAARIPKQNTADRFASLTDALDAAREYSEDRGYVVVPFVCSHCSVERKPVWHLRAAAEVDLSKEQEEIRVQVNDFIASTRAHLRQHAHV